MGTEIEGMVVGVTETVGAADGVTEGEGVAAAAKGVGVLEGVLEGVLVGDEPGDTVAEGVGGAQAVRPTLPLYPLAPAVALTAGQLAAENALARARFTKLLPPPPPHWLAQFPAPPPPPP
jgi:hypothetical protein